MRRLPRPIGILLIALLLATVLLLDLPGRTLWQRVLQDAGHGPVFAAIAIVLLWMRDALAAPTGAECVRALAVATLLGMATEFAQFYLPARNVSALDVLHDAAGATVAIAAVVLLASPAASARDVRSGWVALGLGALVLLAWAPLDCARAYAERRAVFPTLAPTGPTADSHFVAARSASLELHRLPDDFIQGGTSSPAIRLVFAPDARPALELIEARPDWRGYTVLAVDLTNPGPQPASFILRVLDADHDWSHEDRLNLPVVIPARTRTVVRVATEAIAAAPARRRLDLGRIANVMLFATRPIAGGEFYVSRVWLE